MEISIEVSQELKIELTYGPAIQLPSLEPKEMTTDYPRDICALTFTQALSIIAKIGKQLKHPSTNK